MNRYNQYYLEHVRLILLTKYNYNSFNEIQTFKRIDLSLDIKDTKTIVSGLSALLLLTNKGTYSSKKIGSSNHFKSESQKKLILKSCLFGPSIFFFIDNLINYYIPRIRYFKGFNSKSLSAFGNLSFVFNDLMVFPQLEDELELFYKLKNLQMIILVGKKSVTNIAFFYSLFGLNFID